MAGAFPVVGGDAENRATMAVMLSRPPRSFASDIRRVHAASGPGSPRKTSLILGVRQHLGETVRAEQELVIDAQFKAVSFCVHPRFGSTDDVGDDVPQSVHTCLGHIELAAAFTILCDHRYDSR